MTKAKRPPAGRGLNQTTPKVEGVSKRETAQDRRNKKIAADIDQLVSSAKAIEEATEFDRDRSAAMIRKLPKFTRKLWQSINYPC